jgi:choline dehydrogenase-like flavoprotein
MRRREFIVGAVGLAGAAVAGGLYVAERRGRWKEVRGSVDHSEYEGPFARLTEIADDAVFDVCVVGSGPAGTFLASELADRGVRTLILEAGLAPSEMMKDPRYGKLNGGRNVGSINYSLTTTHLMAPGGTSALWNGRCPRLTVPDFEPNAYTPVGSAWPIKYADLEPFYGRAEKSLHVEGEPQGANHSPRSTQLKPATRLLPPDAPIRKLVESAGLDNSEVILPPSSVSPNGPGPIRVARDVLAGVAKKQGITLVLGATAHRIVDDESGRIVALTARDIDGNEKRIRARSYVIAGGAVETARRLLLCRSERWPQGLGNRHGRVGLSFSDHTGLHFSGVVEMPRRHEAGAYQRARNFQFYDPLKKAGFGSMMLHMGVRPEDEESDSPRHLFEMITEMEMEFSDSNRISLSTDATALDAFGDPFSDLSFGFSARDMALHEKAREIVNGIYRSVGATSVEESAVRGWGHHHMGTVRMGNDPATSVVDANLLVHGLKNLHLVTSGVHVCSGAVNPTLTIVALSHRLADHLVAQLGNGGLPAVST